MFKLSCVNLSIGDKLKMCLAEMITIKSGDVQLFFKIQHDQHLPSQKHWYSFYVIQHGTSTSIESFMHAFLIIYMISYFVSILIKIVHA